jgi:spore germination protein YaaH
MMLRRHPRIRGVYAWMMGQEDPRVWRELERLLHARSRDR